MSAFPETSRIHQNIIPTFHLTQEHTGVFYEEVFEQRSNEDKFCKIFLHSFESSIRSSLHIPYASTVKARPTFWCSFSPTTGEARHSIVTVALNCKNITNVFEGASTYVSRHPRCKSEVWMYFCFARGDCFTARLTFNCSIYNLPTCISVNAYILVVKTFKTRQQ